MYAALLKEYALYKKYGYDCKGYEIPLSPDIQFASEEQGKVLRTPIDYGTEYALKYL